MRASIAVLLLLCAACSSSSGSDAQKQVSDLCDRLQDKLCGGLEACGCAFGARGYDAGSCRTKRASDCRATFAARVVPDLEAARVKVHAPGVDACVAGIDELAKSCTSAGQDFLPPACALLFVDVAEVGADCKVSGGGLLFCAQGAGICSGSGSDRPRTCTALPAKDQPCAGGLCAQGLVCSDDVCRTPGAMGSACGSDAACAGGLVCGASATCAKPAGEGASCSRTKECAAGLRCESGACAKASAKGEVCRTREVCGTGAACFTAPETRTCGTPVNAGETCELGTCADGLQCDQATSSCVTNPSEGAPCDQGAGCAEGYGCSDGDRLCHKLPKEGETCFMGDRFCAPGLGCDESTQTCRKGGGNGSACLLNPPDYVCAEGFGCDFASSSCKPLAGNGSKCETDRTCSADTFCSDGTCRPRLPQGSACPGGNECQHPLICAGFGPSARCQPVPKQGEPCFQTCEQGLVCKGEGGRCGAEFCLLP